MIETWSVVIMIVGIIMGFSGAFIGLAATSMKRPIQELQDRVDRHDLRLVELEKLNAVREAEIRSILAGIAELKVLLGKHLDRE
jgi:hypothetical protein